LSGNIFVVEEKFLIHSQRMQKGKRRKTYLMKNVRKIYKIRKLSFIFLRKMSKVEEIEE
jgi:hypothetical protein